MQFTHRGLCVSELYDKYGLSRRKGTNLKNNLTANGLLMENKVSNGRGKPRVELTLTEKGCEYIGLKTEPEDKEKLPGKGSLEHKQLQDVLKDTYRAKGMIAVVEADINGKKIDVLIQEPATKHNIAIEIHLNRKFGLLLEQIKKNFEAGVDEQHIYVPKDNLKEVEEYVRGNFAELNGKIEFYSIPESIPGGGNNKTKEI